MGNLFSLHTLKIFGGFKFRKSIFITKTVVCSEGKSARVRIYKLVTGRDDMKEKRGKKVSPTTGAAAGTRRERERHGQGKSNINLYSWSSIRLGLKKLLIPSLLV